MVICSFMVRAQGFAPTGAKWYYGQGFAFSSYISYLSIESVGDTLIAGQSCKKLINNGGIDCSFQSHPYMVYEEDSTVYFYVPDLDTFQVLYDFKALAGDSWRTVFNTDVSWDHIDTVSTYVDSIGQRLINGFLVKELYVSMTIHGYGYVYGTYQGVINQRFGDVEYMFRLFTNRAICDGNYSLGLRCYEDPEIGFYSTGIAPTCEYQWVSVGDEEMSSLTVHPNPTNGHLKVTGLVEGDLKVHVIDCIGREVMNQKLTGSQLLDISRLRDGIYLFRFEKDGAFVGVKRIVKTS